MKETTLKLSGHSKDRFLERFFAEEPGLATDMAQRLTARGKATFTSLRVRKAAMSVARRQSPASIAGVSRGVEPKAASDTPAIVQVAVEPATASPSKSASPAPAFDAYAIGLVPVFQREGRDGLIGRLAAIDRLDHLRQMAKAQQIVLPQALRTGETSLTALRSAIADSVAKRIADRRAAAG